ncbi:MAG: TonB-dependent receptor [Verrucomicrobiales bacterium]|nr:TonB-dependent receptor [Verrucomicrobiales bacterium]
MNRSLHTNLSNFCANRYLLAVVLSVVSLVSSSIFAEDDNAVQAEADAADQPSELEATVVSAAPVRKPVVNQTVRQATATRPVEIDMYDTLTPELITGSGRSNYSLPGSGYFITAEDIRDQNYTNINRVLAKVPGVYAREEDGSGMFPNISIRGVDGTRNEKITVMEDGILQAPAPYAAPSAYYSPNGARMAGIEILKGAGQIKYGPNTTGGVINYLSTPIPDQEQFYLRTIYESFNGAQIFSHYGNTVDTAIGKIGFLGEVYYKRSDGFRTIDGASKYGIAESDQTGYEIFEPMVKFFWEPDTVLKQRFEFKYGYTDFTADETYVGLTENDFGADPYRRYAGTFLDNISTQQHRSYLKYKVAATDNLDIQVAGYYNTFKRNWFKIREVNGAALHRTLGPTGNAADLATLRGQAPGTLGYRNNSREYKSYGVQASADWRVETGELDHTFSFGVRQHEDEIRRFQEDEDIILGGTNPVINKLGAGSGGNRFQQSTATALWLQDTVEAGNFTFTPGVRYENVKLHNTDYKSDASNTPTAIRNGGVDWFVAGMGVNYDFDERNSLFGGVHQGVSMPSPRSILRSGVELEESVNYELGFRHRSGNFNGELVGFYSDFSNIISTAAGLGQGASQNAGAGEVKGVEALVSYDPWQDKAMRLPMYFSGTWTDATLNNALASGGGEDIYSGGVAGAAMPYIPEWKLAVGVGLETEKWGLDVAATYVSDTFGTALNSPQPIDSSRQGRIDGGIIVDLAAYYHLNDSVKFIGGVQNAFEEVMISSRVPEGPRANAPRMFYVGVEILWEPRSILPSLSGKSVVSK